MAVTTRGNTKPARRNGLKPGAKALVPSAGVSGDWLDDKILAGRMFIGSSQAEHDAVCNRIRAERAAR
jgi:hypothetical protein